jgi:hypothetical protein
MALGQPDGRSGVAPATSASLSWLQLPALNPGPAIDIVGESHYQDTLEHVGGRRSAFGVQNQLITVELVREPTNPYDPNAVKIQADGHHLGYLPREDAPRFHALIDRLTARDRPATCRARLIGGWDRGPHDRGSIGLRLLTGRRPAIWNGRVAFLPDRPFHEHHEVQLLTDLAAEQWPKDKAVVGLVAAGAGALAVCHGDTWLGHIIGRQELVAYVNCVTAAGLPPTAQLRVSPGRLIVPLADQDATISHLTRLGSEDLPTVRRKVAPTGRWACQRCGRLWQDLRHPHRRWYDLTHEDGPHVCPGCFSYAFTHPM